MTLVLIFLKKCPSLMLVWLGFSGLTLVLLVMPHSPLLKLEYLVGYWLCWACWFCLHLKAFFQWLLLCV